LRLMIRQSLRLALVGLALGLSASLALSRWLHSFLFGVSATDPITYVIIGLLLTGVILLSSYLPARRATQVDPMVALRHE
jgi:putative ABC transport system permease protein